MDDNLAQTNQVADEEEYILLDLDDVCLDADIPVNASYVLSGLDTMNPMLVIGDRLKLIGEYQETMGTCYVFTERDSVPTKMCSETTRETTLEGKESVDLKGPSKQVKPIASLHKILKFKLVSEDQNEMSKKADSIHELLS